MVSWDDVLFGVLTGGAYNAVKAAAQAGDVAGKIGDDIGKSVAITTEKALTLLDEVTGFVSGLEQLLVIKRIAPRDEDDLWDEDKERLAELRNLEASYEAEYKKKGGADTYTTTLTQSIVDWMMGRGAAGITGSRDFTGNDRDINGVKWRESRSNHMTCCLIPFFHKSSPPGALHFLKLDVY